MPFAVNGGWFPRVSGGLGLDLVPSPSLKGWLANLGPHAIAVLVLLALAADRRGASFYSRDRMAAALGMSRHDLDQGLARLVADRLVAHRPWRHNCADGVWQLLPVPVLAEHPRAGRTLSAAELLRSLGFQAADTKTAE